jgi:hypothetical protein
MLELMEEEGKEYCCEWGEEMARYREDESDDSAEEGRCEWETGEVMAEWY